MATKLPPLPSLGQNSNASELRQLCPKRADYPHCFRDHLQAKYLVTPHWQAHELCPNASSTTLPPQRGLLRCTSDLRGRRLLLVLGVMSYEAPDAQQRRRASRSTWMRHPSVGVNSVVCFVISKHYEPRIQMSLAREQAVKGDILLVDEKETHELIRSNTKYSQQPGRAMPTFKQYAFYQV